MPEAAPEIDPQAAREQLQRILASDGFAKADRLSRFLRFTVEAKLNGEGDQIKEYLLGREVFDRDGDYDPRLDPIVRVEARRLRAKLDEYYSGAGQTDPVRIEFPKGNYSPVIRPAVVAVPLSKVRWSWVAIAIVTGLLIGTVYWATASRAPMLAVAPASWAWNENDDDRNVEENLAELVAGELANAQMANVVAWPSMLSYRTQHKSPKAIGEELGAKQILLVAVRKSEKGQRINLYLLDPVRDQKLWFGERPLGDPSNREALRETARLLAEDVALRR